MYSLGVPSGIYHHVFAVPAVAPFFSTLYPCRPEAPAAMNSMTDCPDTLNYKSMARWPFTTIPPLMPDFLLIPRLPYCVFVVLQFMIHSLNYHPVILHPVHQQIPVPFKMDFMEPQPSQPLTSTIPKTVCLLLQHFYRIIEILHQAVCSLRILQHKIDMR